MGLKRWWSRDDGPTPETEPLPLDGLPRVKSSNERPPRPVTAPTPDVRSERETVPLEPMATETFAAALTALFRLRAGLTGRFAD
jgi:hypothetical protein